MKVIETCKTLVRFSTRRLKHDRLPRIDQFCGSSSSICWEDQWGHKSPTISCISFCQDLNKQTEMWMNVTLFKVWVSSILHQQYSNKKTDIFSQKPQAQFLVLIRDVVHHVPAFHQIMHRDAILFEDVNLGEWKIAKYRPKSWQLLVGYGGFHKWGYPIYGLIVFTIENPIETDDMMNRGTPIPYETSIWWDGIWCSYFMRLSWDVMGYVQYK